MAKCLGHNLTIYSHPIYTILYNFSLLLLIALSLLGSQRGCLILSQMHMAGYTPESVTSSLQGPIWAFDTLLVGTMAVL